MRQGRGESTGQGDRESLEENEEAGKGGGGGGGGGSKVVMALVFPLAVTR